MIKDYFLYAQLAAATIISCCGIISHDLSADVVFIVLVLIFNVIMCSRKD